ncbi:hypothetical protein [Amycolatopsis sp. NPDC051903]|uniref:hypothetical protein n=1 Tax=Amycolatopsis sp. NPDC051903 TaxID=3363936 RepID=UPI0037A57280
MATTPTDSAALRRLEVLLDHAGVPATGRKVREFPRDAVEIVELSRAASRYELGDTMPSAMSAGEGEGLA